jgi:hypothetical protein
MILRRAILFVVILSSPLRAQDAERAIKTESAELLPVGRVSIELGAEFLHRARYSLSGLEGDLLRLGTMQVRFGVGEYAEFSLSGVGRDYLTITHRTGAILPTTFTGDSTSDFGDMILATKLKLAPEKGNLPAISFRFGVQLPNASNESGLGNDETEFLSSVLLSKHLGRAMVSGNLGLAILGSPVQANTQADMLTYGFGIVLPVHGGLEMVGDLSGRQGPVRIGNENLSQMQAGVRFRAAGLMWELTGVAGLKPFNPHSGLTIGIKYDFQAFHKNRTPVTIRPQSLPVKK